MSKRDINLLLEDMLESAHKIKHYVKDMTYDSFINDDKTIDAVVRNFEIIGEAANRIDPDFRSVHDGIDWNRLRGFRNRIVHNYFGIDYEIVWDIIQNNLNDLIEQIKDISS